MTLALLLAAVVYSSPDRVWSDGTDGALISAATDRGLMHVGPDGKLLERRRDTPAPEEPYLLDRWKGTVSETGGAKRTVKVLREPVGWAVAGDRLFVANLLPYCAATNDHVAAAVSVIDLASFRTIEHVLLPNGSTNVRGICADPSGKHVFVVHTMGRFQLPTTQLERGWMNVAACTVLDAAGRERPMSFLLDDVLLGAANPWSVAVSPDGETLAITHAGTDELSLFELPRLLRALGKQSARSPDGVVNSLGFCRGVGRRRIALGGEGAHGVAFSGGRIFVALYYAEAVAVVDPATGAVRTEKIGLGADAPYDRVRRGEMIYNSARYCFQQWQSCATCHPDGRADGLSWDLLNDGAGNAKQTKSQLYSYLTPPTMVTGIRKDNATCNRAGFTHIQFTKRPEEDLACVDAYTESLRPIASPYLIDGMLSPRAERGRRIYERAGCAFCHGDQTKTPDGKPLYTNCRSYDVGLGTGTERGRRFDTPTLCEVWRTAPYLYDGRSLTILDMLTRGNPDDTHGSTSGLTAEELGDLEEYVLSL